MTKGFRRRVEEAKAQLRVTFGTQRRLLTTGACLLTQSIHESQGGPYAMRAIQAIAHLELLAELEGVR